MELPTYREASRKRVDGKADAIDMFITNWEPRLTEDNQESIDHWREELSWVIKQSQKQKDKKIDEQSHEVNSENLFLARCVLVLMSYIFISMAMNLILLLWRR